MALVRALRGEIMSKRVLLLSGAVSALGLLGSVAHAATPAVNTNAQDTNSSTTVGELVVTAEKREQTLQTVPVAVSAYTAAKRQLIGIDSIQDMTNFTPGLEYNSSTDRISLRGVGRLTNVLSADSSVANYSDGIYETFAVAAGASTLFEDRVEILRGPQGTLYGRNAIGGAINEISRKPTKDWYAEARASYSNYGLYDLEAAISGPITDWLQFRLAGDYTKQSRGWIDNIIPGAPSEGNVIDEKFVEAQLQAQFSPRLEGWLKVNFSEWNNGAGGPGAQSAGWTPYPYDTTEFNNAATQLNPGYGCTGVPTNVVNPSPTGCVNPAIKSPWKIAQAVPYSVQLPDSYNVAAQLVYHADGFDVKYLTGGSRYHYILNGPSAGGLSQGLEAPITSYTLPGGLVIHPQTDFRYQEFNSFWSHEINIVSSNNSPFQWLAGGYYFFQKYQQPVYTENAGEPQLNNLTQSTLFGLCPATGGVCAPSTDYRVYDNRPIISDQSAAAFAQVDWKVTPTIKVTGGMRYSTDEKYGTESVRLLCFGPSPCYSATASEFADAPEFSPFYPGGSIEAIDLTQVPSVIAFNGGPGIVGTSTVNPQTGFATRRYDGHWQALTGTAGIEWTPDADTLLYAKYSRGYKSGGFNIGIYTVIALVPWTGAETVNSYEVGLKKTFFHTLTTNIAAFYYTYDNLQIPVTTIATQGGLTTNTSQFYNVPTSISKGVELETTWQPNKHLTLLFNYSYLDAYATSGAVVDPVDPDALQPGAKPLACSSPAGAPAAGPTPCLPDAFTGGFSRFQSLKGSPLPNSPPNKIAVNGTYTFFFDPGTLSISGSYIWRDVQYGTLFKRWYNQAPSWDQVDARATWTAANGKYKVIVYGKNLFQKIGYDAGAYGSLIEGVNDNNPYLGQAPTIGVAGIAKTYSVTPPRTYGVEIDYKFF
jgi:iron complex outermembrane receptor protein